MSCGVRLGEACIDVRGQICGKDSRDAGALRCQPCWSLVTRDSTPTTQARVHPPEASCRSERRQRGGVHAQLARDQPGFIQTQSLDPRKRAPRLPPVAHPHVAPAPVVRPHWDTGPVKSSLPRFVEVRIEITRGSVVKRRPDGTVEFITGFPCPFNYGSVQGTMAQDGDPLDALVLGSPLPLGDTGVFQVKGVVKFVDAGDVDYKLICTQDVSPASPWPARPIKGPHRYANGAPLYSVPRAFQGSHPSWPRTNAPEGSQEGVQSRGQPQGGEVKEVELVNGTEVHGKASGKGSAVGPLNGAAVAGAVNGAKHASWTSVAGMGGAHGLIPPHIHGLSSSLVSGAAAVNGTLHGANNRANWSPVVNESSSASSGAGINVDGGTVAVDGGVATANGWVHSAAHSSYCADANGMGREGHLPPSLLAAWEEELDLSQAGGLHGPEGGKGISFVDGVMVDLFFNYYTMFKRVVNTARGKQGRTAYEGWERL